MDLKGDGPHARPGGDRPSHGHQGGDQAMNNLGWFRGSMAKMAVAAGIVLGGGYWPCRRVRHDRGACRGVTVAKRVPGCRPVDQCIAVDRRLTVNSGANHAEPWQWLGPQELPQYVEPHPQQ